MQTPTFVELQRSFDDSPSDICDKPLRFFGWIQRVRQGDGGKLFFIDIYDGTTFGSLKCLASVDKYQGSKFIQTYETTADETHYCTLDFEQLGQSEFLSRDCAVVVDGTLVKSPEKATQDFEFLIYRLKLIGSIQDPVAHPIQKSIEKKVTSLRQYPFLRWRTQATQSLMRIRSKLEFAVHSFMDSYDVIKTDPSIFTTSDCEGAGETFKVSPLMFSKDSEGKPIPVSLAVSSQLQLEATIGGFSKVYTCQKSFRAEKSDTIKHLAEFLHVEYEQAFIQMDELLDLTEKYVKYLIQFVFKSCKKDLDFLESKFGPSDVSPTRTLLTECLDRKFVRIKYKDAIDLIQKLVKSKAVIPDDSGKMKRVKVKEFPKHGDDLGSEHEKLLVRYFGFMSHSEDTRELWKKSGKADREIGTFVFVTHWPLAIKSFYMKQTDDDSGECESFDLLAPRVGELFGGSMREWRYDKIHTEMKKRGMDIGPLQWYLDLRKVGSQPHGGWGMGFARMAMLLTGAPSVRDVVPFPVYYGHCPC
jgi:asparaginyl-tRNA synthetase